MKLPRSIVEELDYAVASGWIGALLPGKASKATLSVWSKVRGIPYASFRFDGDIIVIFRARAARTIRKEQEA